MWSNRKEVRTRNFFWQTQKLCVLESGVSQPRREKAPNRALMTSVMTSTVLPKEALCSRKLHSALSWQSKSIGDFHQSLLCFRRLFSDSWFFRVQRSKKTVPDPWISTLSQKKSNFGTQNPKYQKTSLWPSNGPKRQRNILSTWHPRL